MNLYALIYLAAVAYFLYTDYTPDMSIQNLSYENAGLASVFGEVGAYLMLIAILDCAISASYFRKSMLHDYLLGSRTITLSRYMEL